MNPIDLESNWRTIEATVHGYLLRRLAGDRATVDDLTQETFLRLNRHRDDLRDERGFGPWVMRIARSVLVDHLRRVRPGSPIEIAEVLPPLEEPELSDKADLGRYVHAQVDALPDHEAIAIRMVDVAGVAPADAADRLGLGLPALKARLRRGRLHLREAVDRCCAVTVDGRGHPIACEPRPAFAACC